jgi:hypothetical protein
MTNSMEIRFTPTAEDHMALSCYWTRYHNRLLVAW